jgi:hypothetical protein
VRGNYYTTLAYLYLKRTRGDEIKKRTALEIRELLREAPSM